MSNYFVQIIWDQLNGVAFDLTVASDFFLVGRRQL